MPESLTIADFAPYVGRVFPVIFSDGQIDLRLAEATPLGRQTSDPERAVPGRPFSLIFVHEQATVYLPQRTYTVEHPALGRFELFIVPIGPEPGGMRYQAIFT